MPDQIRGQMKKLLIVGDQRRVVDAGAEDKLVEWRALFIPGER